MFAYYLDLALRSFRRNPVLTALMVLALGLGIGASITTLTVLKLLSGDPLPQKSARIFTPLLDPTPADGSATPAYMPRWWGNLMTYTDAMNLLSAHQAERQAVVSLVKAKIAPSQAGAYPFYSNGVMTTADFFAMFDAPFEYGGGWSAQDGENRAPVAVIAARLNDKLFEGKDSVGRTVRVNGHDYRVVGVLKPWAPQPRFYALALGGTSYGMGDGVFLPLLSARADHMNPENYSCWESGANLQRLETAPCAWVSIWIELAHASDARAYTTFLSNYAHQQVALGRFSDPKVWFYDLMGYLQEQQVVPDDVQMQTYLAFGFLLICIVGTVGLLLAKCLGRSHEIGTRRALGASRAAIFAQFMVESGMVGIAGGVLGLLFAEIGLWEIRHEPVQYAHLAHLDPTMFLATFVVALVASLVAGLLPALRACLVAPAPQLKSV
ncbi:MAG TPA: ABC transporter permease [Rhodanobacteraceae bacterium]|nr:ABC transporter permease [Rhodanobacteraceae bacterium]